MDWKIGKRIGNNAENIPQISLDHLNLTVRNFQETADWYRNLFGFEVVETGMEDDGPWGVLRNGDSMLCVYESPERQLFPGTGRGGVRYHQIFHFGLRIRDRAVWEKALKEYRIPVDYGGAYRHPHSTSWYITDPTGYRIEVALWDEDRVKFG